MRTVIEVGPRAAVEVSGSGGWYAYSNGKTPPQPAESDPNIPFAVFDPPQGKSVTDQGMAATRRDFSQISSGKRMCSSKGSG